MKKLALALLVVVGCRDGSTRPPWGVPITGGTMIVARDGHHAVIADPDRDRVLWVKLATGVATYVVELSPGDEPGRLVEDDRGRIHVALRRGGSIVTLADGQIVDNRFACSEPRGLAWDAAASAIHVACTGGELVTLRADGGPAIRTLRLDRDLRDVVVSGNQLVVTRFRSAELLTLDAAGNVVGRAVPPTVKRLGGFGGDVPFHDEAGQAGLVDSVPTVAWRTIALPDGRLLVSHQRHTKRSLDNDRPGGYGGGCGNGPVESALTVVAPGAEPRAVLPFARGALPVDIAVSPAGDRIAVVTAGNRKVMIPAIAALDVPDQNGGCMPPDPEDDDDRGRPTSVAFAPNGELVVFYPERPALLVGDRTFDILGDRGIDHGRDVFHQQTSLGLACASCHAEGREDGQIWSFSQIGLRRTQSLAGHVLERAPFHWSGDMASLQILMTDVFTKRMAGGELADHQTAMLGPWLDRIPAPAPIAGDAEAIERGRTLFASPRLACASCHNGDLMSNKQLVDVGTGGAFKVPSLLGLAARAPYLHDGCAATLTDRFTTCGGGDAHGGTSQLSAPELADLVAYLESL